MHRKLKYTAFIIILGAVTLQSAIAKPLPRLEIGPGAKMHGPILVRGIGGRIIFKLLPGATIKIAKPT